MKSNPILEEVWRIKDQLAAEAGHDVDHFFANLRKWEAEHPHSSQVVHGAEELRQLAALKKLHHAEEAAMVLNDQSPRSL